MTRDVTIDPAVRRRIEIAYLEDTLSRPVSRPVDKPALSAIESADRFLASVLLDRDVDFGGARSIHR